MKSALTNLKTIIEKAFNKTKTIHNGKLDFNQWIANDSKEQMEFLFFFDKKQKYGLCIKATENETYSIIPVTPNYTTSNEYSKILNYLSKISPPLGI